MIQNQIEDIKDRMNRIRDLGGDANFDCCIDDIEKEVSLMNERVTDRLKDLEQETFIRLSESLIAQGA